MEKLVGFITGFITSFVFALAWAEGCDDEYCVFAQSAKTLDL